MVLESPDVLNGNGKAIEYFHKNIWSELGQENSLNIIVDWQHHPAYFGGASVTLRDAARFGLMMLNEGKNMEGKQLVPKAVVQDILNGGDETNLSQMKNSTSAPPIPFDAYRNQFWVRKAGKVFLQLGIHGQVCYIDVENDIVIVSFGSNAFSNVYWGSIPDVFDPIIEYLKSQGGGGDVGKKGKKGKKEKKEKNNVRKKF